MTNLLVRNVPDLVLSARLGYLVHDVIERGSDALPAEVGVGTRMEAERYIAMMEQSCVPAPEGMIRQWLDLVAISVGQNAPDPKQRRAHLVLVLSTSGDLPRACWTVQTRAEFARHRGERGGFWPSDGEIDAFLRPIGQNELRQLRALKQIRDKGLERRRATVERRDAPPTAAEIEAVSRSVAAALTAIAEEKAKLPPEPEPVSTLRDVTFSGQELGELRRQRFAKLHAAGALVGHPPTRYDPA